ncbi:MAG: 16S rRNA (cytosine(1402)-N(4))-methyltransferase RsmH [Metamycoplasmataceae bacterium]
MEHIPVLLTEVIENLEIKKDGIYLDLTLGRGGHTQEILKRLNKDALMVGFDKDLEAIEKTRANLSKYTNLKLIHSDFKNLENELSKLQIKSVDGILIDLGVSSPQIDQQNRGFSYRYDAYLDMRMDQRQTLDAFYVVNNYDVNKLGELFRNNADVKEWKIISNAIVKNRPIKTTFELNNVIKESLPAFILRKKNPSKAIFQAIRMEVNNEVESLKEVLVQSIKYLKKDGKLLVISFHSVEDKIVKNFFGNLTKQKLDPKMPLQEEKVWCVKTINVSEKEKVINKRARSAKLRILKKVGDYE